MSIAIIIPARYGSSRYEGKPLIKINKIPLTVLCAKRLNNTNIPVIVAIPKTKENILLKKILRNNRLKTICGNHLNVFDRYYKIIKNLKDDTIIVRATSDNPLPEGFFVKKMINLFNKKKLDYLDTTAKNFSLPYGLALQIFRAKTFKKINRTKLTRFDKEHVPTIFSKMENIKTFKKKYLEYKNIYSKEKFSIDTSEDYKRMKKVFSYTKKTFSEQFQVLIKRYYDEKRI